VRAGDLVWLAIAGDQLVAFDADRLAVQSVRLEGSDRRGLAAAADAAAWAGRDAFGEEQLYLAIEGGGTGAVQATTGGFGNRIGEIAGFAAGTAPLAPRALTVAPVSDGLGGQRETLFLFGDDGLGLGRLFAYRFDPVTAGEQIASTDLGGAPLTGLEIAR
jgi:hypothetical protein